jgi:Flp pilus assembly protein TadD
MRCPVLLALAAALAASCAKKPAPQATSPWEKPEGATYVGRTACAACHQLQTGTWRTSHHAMAMAEPTPGIVSGNFEDASFTTHGITSTFTKKDGKYFARTDGPDGALHDYEIAWTFGVYPLQQYLIRFPKGRVQALNVCWDARPESEGGQRWFHLYPNENVPSTDILHWTGPYQNWNFMCADCHSTNVKKGYDTAADAYATTFSEIDVSCEACHGPGSAHVAWAEAVKERRADAKPAKNGVLAGRASRDGAQWVVDPVKNLPRRTIPRTEHAEIEMCARCHARRSVVADGYVPGAPLMDFYRPQLLEAPLYFADGQIQDEVYEYGSFLQSRMYASGVTCTDCHDAHTMKLRAPGDAVCGRCHVPEVYAAKKHHFHAANGKGASCTACHMPTRDYMVVHARRDHSIRIPRPDVAAKIGAPDACLSCHAKKGAAWNVAAFVKWWPKRAATPHPGEAIHAGREGLAGARAALAALVLDPKVSAPMRGTAAALLGRHAAADSMQALDVALGASDPLVRTGAVAGLREGPAGVRLSKLFPLLSDPVRAVRIDAARSLATVPEASLTPAQASSIRRGLAEWRKAQLVDADRAEAHLNLGALAAEQGDGATAESEYRRALAIAPGLPAVTVNLADLYRQLGRDGEAEGILGKGIAMSPASADLRHSLGLLRVRQKRLPEACEELGRAAKLQPESAHYAFVHAVALEAAGRTRESARVLEKALARHTGDPEILSALLSASLKANDAGAALRYARRLSDVVPGDDAVRGLVAKLSGAAR